ncbi:DUF262 domain-containing protein [Sedimentisphaera salicampi]|uniref:DUF262 domain-containing protein n=1 Tax=Sedimentisphaera salicampi TaxID=1941349 RepID=UPI000B9B944A|nr:DUF262 domain-containing protein [Sedimentisphaera salicampi]OXU14551.1 hypothetical protein SMSP1_01728 [Sedimentisphaera salicampi]
MNVWKIGSKYGSEGNILEIFGKYQVVFAGNADDCILNNVKCGDLVAVADGFSVLAVAKVLSETPQTIEHFNFDETDTKRFAGAIGVKVKLYHLEKDDYLWYKNRKSFSRAYQINSDIEELYDNYSNAKFDIQSYAKTLGMVNDENDNDSIINSSINKYIVPIYQRPYSWKQWQLEKLIVDIFEGYKIDEPIFIGSIQFSHPVPLLGTKKKIREIIDGQQRIVSFLLLIKFLQLKYPESTLSNVKLDWLETRVNNGEQQKSLKQVLELEQLPDGDIGLEVNTFFDNMVCLGELFESNKGESEVDDGKDNQFEIEKFIAYLSNSIHFICVETRAGLSKTLKIFDTINTAGLDLGGSDLFKIKCYEYMTSKADYGEEAFKKISKLYEIVESQNRDYAEKNVSVRSSMDEILEIYKFVLVAQNDLPKWMPLRFGRDTFYERLFDSILGVKNWSKFGFGKNAKETKIKTEDIQKIINAKYEFENILIDSKSSETACCDYLICWSRYHRFRIIGIIACAFCKDVTCENIELLMQKLARLFVIYSCNYAKRINYMSNFLQIIISELCSQKLITAAIEEIDKKINEAYKGEKSRLEHVLSHLAWNAKSKALLCRLSAMLDELDGTLNPHELTQKLFCTDIDIEHIQSYNDEDMEARAKIQEEWGDEINSVGNLVMLERTINRSISNSFFEVKKEQYRNSDFVSVKKLCQKQNWTQEDCKQRKEVETERLTKYLFELERK